MRGVLMHVLRDTMLWAVCPFFTAAIGLSARKSVGTVSRADVLKASSSRISRFSFPSSHSNFPESSESVRRSAFVAVRWDALFLPFFGRTRLSGNCFFRNKPRRFPQQGPPNYPRPTIYGESTRVPHGCSSYVNRGALPRLPSAVLIARTDREKNGDQGVVDPP